MARSDNQPNGNVPSLKMCRWSRLLAKASHDKMMSLAQFCLSLSLVTTQWHLVKGWKSAALWQASLHTMVALLTVKHSNSFCCSLIWSHEVSQVVYSPGEVWPPPALWYLVRDCEQGRPIPPAGRIFQGIWFGLYSVDSIFILASRLWCLCQAWRYFCCKPRHNRKLWNKGHGFRTSEILYFQENPVCSQQSI